MVLETLSRIGGNGKKQSIYLPIDMVSDSQFPFKVGDSLEIKKSSASRVIAQKTDAEKHRWDSLCTIQGLPRKMWLYIPKKVIQSGEFPFHAGDSVKVKIKPDSELFIEQAN